MLRNVRTACQMKPPTRPIEKPALRRPAERSARSTKGDVRNKRNYQMNANKKAKSCALVPHLGHKTIGARATSVLNLVEDAVDRRRRLVVCARFGVPSNRHRLRFIDG